VRPRFRERDRAVTEGDGLTTRPHGGRHVGQRVILPVNSNSEASSRYAHSVFSLPCRRTTPLPSLVNWQLRPGLPTLGKSSAEVNSTPSYVT
jgi:hypothetical protein